MKKLIIVFMSLMLVLGFALPLPSFNHVSAESLDPVKTIQNELEKITDEDFDNATQVIKEGLYIEDGLYKFDKSRVGETTLTDKQIENINVFYSSYLTQDELAMIYGVINNDSISREGMIGTMAVPLIPAAIVAAVGVVVAFVGATIAANIIADMYKLAAASFCKKYKKYEQIKKACKQLGYIK